MLNKLNTGCVETVIETTRINSKSRINPRVKIKQRYATVSAINQSLP